MGDNQRGTRNRHRRRRANFGSGARSPGCPVCRWRGGAPGDSTGPDARFQATASAGTRGGGGAAAGDLDERSVAPLRAVAVAAVLKPSNMSGIAGCSTGPAGFVAEQVLLADIGDVARFRILGEQVVIGLVLGRTQVLRYRLVPFLAVGEDRIDVEDHAAEIEQPVAYDLANREAGGRDRRRLRIGQDVFATRHATICSGGSGRPQARGGGSRRDFGASGRLRSSRFAIRARGSSTGPRVRAAEKPYAERCRSGRTGRSRKPLSAQAFRGFESLLSATNLARSLHFRPENHGLCGSLTTGS